MAAGQQSFWKRFSDGWNRFFFREVRLDSLALIRILLCGVLLIPVASRWPNVREVYSSDGVVTPLSAGYPGAYELPVLNGSAAVALYTGLVFFLIAGMVGWRTRLSLAVASGLLLYFGFLDLISTLTKYTIISCHMLAILACSRCGDVWSVDAWLQAEKCNGRGAIWPLRVIQLFLAILYFATAVTKVKSPEFMSGEHTMFWMQTDMNYAHPMGYWLSTHPALVVVANYLVIVWEVLFVALCWDRKTLKPLLAAGVIFHIGTYTLLGLVVFPLVMLSLYPAFVSPERVRAVLLAIQRRVTNWPALPGLGIASHAWAFPLILGVMMVTAIEAEYHLDPMGSRAEKPALPALDPALAKTMLETTNPKEPSDWVHRIDVGKSIVAGVVGGESSTFKTDDTVQVQIWLQMPHPDMYVHIDIHDEADLPILRDGTAITRESHRYTVPYLFANNLRPGKYAFVFHDETSLIARHEFEIVE